MAAATHLAPAVGRSRPRLGGLLRSLALTALLGLGLVAALALGGVLRAGADQQDPWHRVGDADDNPSEYVSGVGPGAAMVAGYPVSFRVAHGDVELRGMVKTDNAVVVPLGPVGLSQVRLFKLPCGYRPRHQVIVPVAVAPISEAGVSAPKPAVAMVESGGMVEVIVDQSILGAGPAGVLSALVTLDGTYFEHDEPAVSCEANHAGSLWVAPTEDAEGNPDHTGSDLANGDQDHPFATIQHALDLVQPGQTIYLQGGVHKPSATLRSELRATADHRVTFTSAPGEHAVIDGSAIGGPSLDYVKTGEFTWSYWDISNIGFTKGPAGGPVCFGCSHTTWTNIDSFENFGPGLGLAGGGDGSPTEHNIIRRSDFHDNRDSQAFFESADGLDIFPGHGEGNQVIESRSWGNSDDGFDAFSFTDPITFDRNWSFENGVPRDGEPQTPCGSVANATCFGGDGNGFKMGGMPREQPTDNPDAALVEHVIRRNLAFANSGDGITSNGNPGPLHVYQNVAYRNLHSGLSFYIQGTQTPAVTPDVRNNISYDNGSGDAVTFYDEEGNSHDGNDLPTDAVNAWSYTADDHPVTDDDFLDRDMAPADGPRGTDGSLPDIDLLHLNPASPLVDAGTPIGTMRYADAAPDLGAFETPASIVNSTGDRGLGSPNSTKCDTGHTLGDIEGGTRECTLRAAIEAANNADVGVRIKFAIGGTGAHTIELSDTELPITTSLYIDGFTQPGSHPNTTDSPEPFDAEMKIVVDGIGLPAGQAPCFAIHDTSFVTLRGLDVIRCGADGIRIDNADHTTIIGSYLGVDHTGLQAAGNGRPAPGNDFAGAGIAARGVHHTRIGGTDPADRVIVAASNSNDIVIDSDYRGADPQVADTNTFTTIQGTYLGLAADGLTPLPNGFVFGHGNALLVTHSGFDVIGGGTPGAGNVIASSAEYGISLRDGTHDTLVQGNRVGTDWTGNAAAVDPDQLGDPEVGTPHAFGSGNPTAGISVAIVSTADYQLPPHDIVIGGTRPGQGNVIAANVRTQDGQQTSGINIHDFAHHITVEGNKIGVGADGTTALPNGTHGIMVMDNTHHVTIGGDAPGAGNIIGATHNGIENQVDNVTIQGNYVGITPGGTPLTTGEIGINSGTGSSVTIGGDAAGAGNTVANQTVAGIVAGGSEAVVHGNRVTSIGAETVDRRSPAAAISVTGSYASVAHNVIGLTESGASSGSDVGIWLPGFGADITDNTVAASRAYDIEITGSSNQLHANDIGVDEDGTPVTVSEPSAHIAVLGSANRIGGPTAADGNRIASNTTGIIVLTSTGGPPGSPDLTPVANTLVANTIEASQPTTDTLAIDLAADTDGDFLADVSTGPDADTSGGFVSTAANHGVQAPQILDATASGSSLTGHLDNGAGGSPSGHYRIDVYANDTSTGRSQQIYLGSVQLDRGADQAFTIALPPGVDVTGKALTATATWITTTNTLTDTSETSAGTVISG